ncbi:MAG: glycosyltransferase [Caldilineaceae bacterium]
MFSALAQRTPRCLNLAELRANLGIPEDRKLIVYLGCWRNTKESAICSGRCSKLCPSARRVHLLVDGFPTLPTTRNWRSNWGSPSMSPLLGGFQATKPRHLALGDIAVAPKLSVTEGAGKLLNYMAVGLPTVAFDSPVASRISWPGRCLRAGDVDSLVEKLLEIIDGGESARKRSGSWGERLRQHVVQHFSWDMAGRQIISIYDHLIERRAMPSHATSVGTRRET